MATGGGGGGVDRAGSGLYRGRTLNPTPLAVALPAGVGGILDGGSSSGVSWTGPGVWHSAPSIVGAWPAAFPVSVPPVYFTHPPQMARVEFPFLTSLEVRGSPTESSRSSGVVGVMAFPSPFHGTQQLARVLPPSGMYEAGVSSGDRTPVGRTTSILTPSSACDQNLVDKSEPEQEQRRLSTLAHKNAVPPVASSVSPATDLDPSVCFVEPPPVPEGFPRDSVPPGGRGLGWPYAPQGWPYPDDKWGWRVGRRASASSQWIDRYISVPVSLLKGRRVGSKIEFASRKSLVEYLRQTFPQMDHYSIFRAFDWKVPAPKDFEAPEKPEKRTPSVKRDKPLPIEGAENEQKSKKQCRAGNPHCLFTNVKGSESLVCHICCSEPSFCRGCKCILCCKFFAPDADDFSIIRCLNSPTSGQGVCGHAAHLECALDSRLAGVVKKNGLNMEYMCRRCDRKTDLKETVSRLVFEFMSKTATESKVESSLQHLLRVVQDSEEESQSNLEKLQATLNGALMKVQVGADIVESCKELTEQLYELRSGQGVQDSQVSHHVPNWSRAMQRKGDWEDSLHPSETTSVKMVAQFNSVGSPDARIASMIGSQEGCEADAVATTSGTRVKPDLDMGKELPSASLEDSLKPDDHVLHVPTPLSPSELLPCTPLLSSVWDKRLCKSPTLTIEEHIRQCEAMTSRVKGAGLLAAAFHGNQVISPEAEASHNAGLPCAEELVTSIHSSSRAKSPSLFKSEDAAEDHVANTEIIKAFEQDDKVEEVCVPNAFGSSKTSEGAKRATEDGNKTTEDAGGDDAPSTKIIEVSESSRIMPPTTSSPEAKVPSLANSQGAGGDDVVMAQIIDVPMAEPPTIPSFDPALDAAHASGLEAEFEEQISEALEKLKRAQGAEFARAEESLNAQKKIVIEQYRQLENVCGQFAKKENAHLFPHQFKKNQGDKSRAEFDRAMEHLMAQYGKAQEGQKEFESMLAISNGFGQVSKEFLQEFFKWPPSDITEA